MALFKVNKGKSINLQNQTWHDGYAYFTTDDGLFHIDYYTENVPPEQQTDSTKKKRIPLNAKKAECDVNGKKINETYVYADISASDTDAFEVPKTNSDQLGGLDANAYVTLKYLNNLIDSGEIGSGGGGSSTGTSTVNLNGTAVTYASFFAPVNGGTNGYILKSNGDGAPTWTDQIDRHIVWTNEACPVVRSDRWPQYMFQNANGDNRGLLFVNTTDGSTGAIVLRTYDDNGNYKEAQLSTDGNFSASQFVGSGVYLTDLNASNLASGTVPPARLPAATSSALGAVKIGSNITVSSGTISLTKANVTAALGYTPPTSDTNTTYTFTTGDSNGQIKVVASTGSSANVAVKGLGSNAYTSTAYLPLAGGTVTGATVFSNTTASSSTTTGAVKISGGLGVAGKIYGSEVYGAMWNDYAEFRQTVSDAKPGQVVVENGDGSLTVSSKRLQPGCEIVSDTFGFAIGETDNCKTPIAVSGRVLVYAYEDRYSYNPGDAVCSGPNGTVSKMTREEIMMYPERIIGTVSEIPEYETWGTGNVEVNGRIWVKVK